MSKNKVLDTALSLIDKHIRLDHKEIARIIYAETTYCDQDFNKFFSVISSGSLTLRDYIRERRLYLAVCDAIDNPQKALAGLPKATRSGYTFAGWYTKESGGTQVADGAVVTSASNHTLYAHWTADDFIVVFNKNGGSGSMSNQPIARDQSVALTANTFTAPTGYTFSKWNTKADGSGTSYTDKQAVKTSPPLAAVLHCTLYGNRPNTPLSLMQMAVPEQ